MRRSKAITIYPISGPHNVYIFQDMTKERFKIGITSYNLTYYRKQLCAKEYGRRAHHKIATFHSWRVGDFFAAFFLEQTIIETIKRLGIKRLAGDWFETDIETIRGVMDAVCDLAYQVRKWERTNYRWEDPNYRLWCNALHHELSTRRKIDTPYGKRVKSLPRGYFGQGLILSDLAPA
jgi:hypothetical protein